MGSPHKNLPATGQTALMAEISSSDIPKTWHDQNLLRILAKKGGKDPLPYDETECSLEFTPPWPVPHCSEFQGDMAPLWRREFLFPKPRLKHDVLREETEGFVRGESNFLSYLY